MSGNVEDVVQIIGSYITLIVFAFVLVVFRVYVKLRVVRNFGPEDYVCIFALACAINSTYFMCREAYLSEDGYDLTQVGMERLSERLKCVYAGWITYNLSVVAVKFSFLLQYLRIFRQKDMRITIWTVCGIVSIYGVWAFFSSVFLCWPIESFWSLSFADTRKNCMSPPDYYVAHAGLSVATDVLILLLPMPGLRRLMLPRGQKFGLILVFLLGGFICIASTLRLAAFVEAFDGSYNMEWGGFSVGVWTSIEMNVAIVCCCLPPLRPAATRVWKRVKSDRLVLRTHRYFSDLLTRSTVKSTKKSTKICHEESAGNPSNTPHGSSWGSLNGEKESEVSSQLPSESTAPADGNAGKGETSWLTMTQTVYEDDDGGLMGASGVGREGADSAV